MIKRTIIIGDIHSCADELQDLLNLIKPDSTTRIISAGDEIHKGEKQNETLDILMNYNVEIVLGNHLEKQFRWENHEARRLEFGKPNPMKNVEDYVPLLPHHKKWLLDTAQLFIRLEVADKKFLIVHGGITRRIKTLPTSTKPDYKSKSYFDLLRTRYEDPNGRMVELGKENFELDNFWAERYDGKFGHCFFGHQPFMEEQPKEFTYATALDLGAVYGNRLATAIIHSDGEVEYATVPARKKYADYHHDYK